uniref:Uncharacterized protein n=1 Tax=Vibrio parahaemolyticus TaxID=670 RepID=A0A7M1WCZ8_VIBPH|nr:hypothetical protein VP358_00006 [Vibrio parahaemolyticus]
MGIYLTLKKERGRIEGCLSMIIVFIKIRVLLLKFKSPQSLRKRLRF